MDLSGREIFHATHCRFCLGLFVFFAGRAGFAKARLDRAGDIEHALAAGSEVAVSVDLSQCTGVAGAPPTKTGGGLRIGSYRIVENGTLSFSDVHITVTREGQPIQQFLRYQVNPDGSIDFTMFVFDLRSYQIRSGPLAYRCGINQGLQCYAD